MVDGESSPSSGPTDSQDQANRPGIPQPPQLDTGHSRQFVITTIVAIAGVVVAAVGVLLGSWGAFAGSDDDAEPSAAASMVSISMDHVAFASLPYEQQLDLCVPYVRDNYVRENLEWRTDTDGDFTAPLPDSLGADNASGQQIVNLSRTVFNMAKREPDYPTGQNLMSCVFNENFGDQSELIQDRSRRPMAPLRVEIETETYITGEYADVQASGRQSKIVQVIIPRTGDYWQYGLTRVSGSTPDASIWVVTAEEDPRTDSWVPDLATWNPS